MSTPEEPWQAFLKTAAADNAPPLLQAVVDLLSVPGGNAEKAAKWLYDVLSIIDTKTSHLLRLNAMILAAETFLLKIVFDAQGAHTVGPLAVLLFPLLPIAVSLSVFRIQWRFLGWKGAGDRIATTWEDELKQLAIACDERTDRYWWIYWLTVLALLSFVALVVGFAYSQLQRTTPG